MLPLNTHAPEDTYSIVRPYKIFIVDDYPLIRQGYRLLIEGADNMSLCGEASDGIGAIEQVPVQSPDLVVTDISMPGMNGIELTSRLRTLQPELVILVSSTYDPEVYVNRLREAGAQGCIQKSAFAEQGLNAILCLLGEMPCPDSLHRL